MGFKVQLVLLAISMLLTSGTERAKEVSARGRRLCLCSDRVLSSQDSEAFSSASCDEMCTFNRNTEVLSNFTRRHLRSRRDVLEDAKECLFNKIHHNWEVYNTKVAFYRSENSSEWFAEVSWSPFNGTSLPWIGYYILYFTGSWSRDEGLDCLIIPKNQTSVNISSTKDDEIINLYVAALPKSLDSANRSTIKDMPLIKYTSEKLTYLSEIPPPVLSMEPPEEKNTVTTYVSMSAGILVGIILAAGLLKYCLCRKKSSYFPPEFEFHAFIIYQKEDSHWVSKQLLPFLEEEHHIKCCIHYRDFTPGLPFHDSMAESVYNSYKIIAVFSSNFLMSGYCIHELDLAQYRLLNKRDDSLIIIRIDKTDPSELPPALQKRNFIDYSDVLERPFWKGRLLKFLKSGSERVSTEQENNNSALEDSNEQNDHRRARVEFDRLNSTTSTATQISMVSLDSVNDDRLI